MGVTVTVGAIARNICRIGVGVTMIYAGVELLRGDGLLSGTAYDSTLTALFAIGLGVYCIFRGGPAQLVELLLARYRKSLPGN